ncbi:MAG: glycosyl hydrolase family 28 protein [Niabella sp.]
MSIVRKELLKLSTLIVLTLQLNISVAFNSFRLLPAGTKTANLQNKPSATLHRPFLFDIRDFGAVPDTVTVNTKAIQSAIDKCNVNGGGVVLIAGGPYVTGTIYLKSNVCLRIESGATLLGSKNIKDYATNTDRTMYRGEPYMNRCLIFANAASNITIEGRGVIDGQGRSFPNRGDSVRNRPKMIRLMNCNNFRLRDITLRAPAAWTTEFRYCNDIAVDGITIYSRANSNGDGLDFDGCTKVRVSNSTFDTSDDAICLQTSLTEYPCRDITINNCHFTSRWAGVRIGLLSRGDFENITISNCSFRDHNDSGLKIQMCEGAEMKNMVFSNLVMKNVPRPVFFTFTQQNAWVDAPPDSFPPMKRVHNILFSNITVDNTGGNKHSAFIITGMPGHPIEHISFSDIRAIVSGGGTKSDAENVLAELDVENIKARWPEYGGLRGTVPAHGLYVRHVKGITVRNMEFFTKVADARPAIVFVDVKEAKVSDAPPPDNR